MGRRVLEALLRNKHRLRPPSEEGGGDDPGDAGHRDREDPLTAAVFSRLSYLPDRAAWALLGAAAQPRTPAPWPDPPTALDWHFWPTLAPGPLGRNRRGVEPDVVAVGADRVVLFEAKHRGAHGSDQWTEQLSAARQRWPDRALALVAVGGLRPEGDAARVAALPASLRVPVFRVSWERLRAVAVREAVDAAPHHQRLLRDIARALVHWRYRPPLPLGGFAAGATPPPAVAVATLAAWRPVGPPRSPAERLVEAARRLAPASASLFADWEPT